MKYGHMEHALPLAAAILVCASSVQVGEWSLLDVMHVGEVIRHHQLVALFWTAAFLLSLRFFCKRKTARQVFLVDFACYKPEEEQKCNYELSEYVTRCSGKFNVPSMEFQRKIFLRSGLGDETYVPPFLSKGTYQPGHEDATLEAQQVLFGSVNELLKKARVVPQDIGILITNCSLFTPTPSHSSMIVNHFRMRQDVKTFHLSGMGCSASVIACGLAKDLLTLYPNQYALVVSTENITLNWYFGNNRSMLVTNCLFRVGCAAILLTNKQSEKSRSKYELQHCIRTHIAAEDKAYGCAFQTEDEEGLVGVTLNKDLMGVAADALKANMYRLGPLVLPLSEQILFVFSLLTNRFLKMKVKQYQPDFKLAFQHFCLHAGGRAVIDSIQKNLYLNDYLLEPSRATLHRFGNTSASCLWYVLAYMEAKQRIKKGEKVWMLGLGSGFKCNSAVWKALHDIPMPSRSPWLDCVHRYPVPLVKSA